MKIKRLFSTCYSAISMSYYFMNGMLIIGFDDQLTFMYMDRPIYSINIYI